MCAKLIVSDLCFLTAENSQAVPIGKLPNKEVAEIRKGRPEASVNLKPPPR